MSPERVSVVLTPSGRGEWMARNDRLRVLAIGKTREAALASFDEGLTELRQLQGQLNARRSLSAVPGTETENEKSSSPAVGRDVT